MLADTLAWSSDKGGPAIKPRHRVSDEAVRWQLASQDGGFAALRSVFDQSAGNRPRRKDANRLVEVHSLMGAIGEQLGLAWTIEQDAQRFRKTADDRMEEHHRLVLRALAEAGGHFLLGACHGLGNLGLRVGLLDAATAPTINSKLRRADLTPGSQDINAWLSLAKASAVLDRAAATSGNSPLQRISACLAALADSDAYRSFNSRRGMDFHRMRPQSVPHASPRRGTSTISGQTATISIPAATLDPEANAEQVYQLLVAVLIRTYQSMRVMRVTIPKSIRTSGYWYHEVFTHPSRQTRRPRRDHDGE